MSRRRGRGTAAGGRYGRGVWRRNFAAAATVQARALLEKVSAVEARNVRRIRMAVTQSLPTALYRSPPRPTAPHRSPPLPTAPHPPLPTRRSPPATPHPHAHAYAHAHLISAPTPNPTQPTTPLMPHPTPTPISTSPRPTRTPRLSTPTHPTSSIPSQHLQISTPHEGSIHNKRAYAAPH